MPAILDTNRSTISHYAALKAAGVITVIRYIAAGLEREEKVIKVAEAEAIAEAGLRLGLVYEISGRPSGPLTGMRDGNYTKNYARTVGAPNGAMIWYTVDWDAGPGDYPGIKAAFAAFKDALDGKFRVGAYASGYICNRLRADGLVDARWLTDSKGFNGTRQALADGAYELAQALPATIAGLDTDPDAVHMAVDGKAIDIGDFIPFAENAKGVEIDPTIRPPQSADAPVNPAPDVLSGKMSVFGGPNDHGVMPDEGLALVEPNEVHLFPGIFLPAQPPGTSGLARRLDPSAHYIACRWDYKRTPVGFLKSTSVKVSANGKTLDARPVDWGPNIRTGRIADLSPGLAAALGLKTDDVCQVTIPRPT